MTNEVTNPEFDVEALIDYMQVNMGMNPFTLYCQVTGKPIGRLNPDELAPFLKGDIDEVADDLFIRILASMRPSIHWNRMRDESLAVLAKSQSIETLAYLLNRLFQPVDHLRIPLARRLDDLHARIRTFNKLALIDPADRERIFAWLIELDAKVNLNQINVEQDFGGVKITGVTRDSFENGDWEDFMLGLEGLYESFIAKWKRNQRLEENQANWFKGNTLARPAFFNSFMEAKPESKTAKGKRIVKERDVQLDALFDAVMLESPEPKPIVIPVEPTKPASHAGTVPSFLIRSK